MTNKQGGRTPTGMDRLDKHLIEYSLFATNLQGIMYACQAPLIAFLCGFVAVLEVVL